MSKEKELDWDLIHKILEGTATQEEEASYAALIPWLRRVQEDQQDKNSPYYAMDAWRTFKKKLPSKPGVFRLWYKAAGIAAAIALIISLGWWLYPASEKPDTTLLTYTVPNGQRKLITLPDSTRIWINAGSLVKIPAETREIYLEGEGYFEVRENASHPFIVHTPEATIRVLGTSFNIEAYSQALVAVTVATGKVQFSRKGGQSVTLTQNQRAVWIAGAFQTSQADASFYNGWRQGILQFNDEPLLKVIATLERKFNIPIKVSGETGKNLYCTAKFAAGESLDNILESLHHIYGLTITKKEGTIQIQSK